MHNRFLAVAVVVAALLLSAPRANIQADGVVFPCGAKPDLSGASQWSEAGNSTGSYDELWFPPASQPVVNPPRRIETGRTPG